MTMNLSIRPPAVAGSFYPADPAKLSNTVQRLLTGFGPLISAPSAVVSPHAGYTFSGRLTAMALAASAGASPDVLVILSPSHRHVFDGIALPSHDFFAIPGDKVPIHDKLRQRLVDAGLAQVEDAAHNREHGVEVQLPILRDTHPEVPILPLVIGEAAPKAVADVVDFLAAQARAPLFILSSDLSHYLTRDQAQAKDALTAKRMETGDTSLDGADACGARALNGYFASRHSAGSRILRLAMRNSADVTGDDGRTVGYGAWAVTPGVQEALSPDLRTRLLRMARQVLASRMKRGKPPHINTETFPAPLQTHAACFVTLEQQGRLRGCIGSLKAHRPLVEDVAVNVQKAAFEDPRFRPLQPEELDRTTLKIAVLSPVRPMVFADQAALEAQLVPHRDGLIMRDGGRAGTFLPMVWDKLKDPHDFVQALKRKAWIPEDHWSATLTVDRFHAESFSERA